MVEGGVLVDDGLRRRHAAHSETRKAGAVDVGDEGGARGRWTVAEDLREDARAVLASGERFLEGRHDVTIVLAGENPAPFEAVVDNVPARSSCPQL